MKNISPARFKETACSLWQRQNKKQYDEYKCGEFPHQSLPIIFVFWGCDQSTFLDKTAFSLFFRKMCLFLLRYLPLVEHTHNSHSYFASASAVCPFMHSFLARFSSKRIIERAKLLQGPHTHLHTLLPSFVVLQTPEGTAFCLQGYCGLGSVTHRTFLPCPRWSVRVQGEENWDLVSLLQNELWNS